MPGDAMVDIVVRIKRGDDELECRFRAATSEQAEGFRDLLLEAFPPDTVTELDGHGQGMVIEIEPKFESVALARNTVNALGDAYFSGPSSSGS